MKRSIKIHPADNVAVVLEDTEEIRRGHKLALEDISSGADIIKYGHSIGHATRDIRKGEWVHTHNMATNLSGSLEYSYEPVQVNIPAREPLKFPGYRRADGRVGIRNEIWVLPLVGCVNDVCLEIVNETKELAALYGLDGIYHFPHPYGCSQLGGDLNDTKNILADLCRHPNAGGVLCVALGCENLTLDLFKEALGKGCEDKVRFLVCQDEKDEVAAAKPLVEELCRYASGFKRSECRVTELVIGMKCGGSDGFSGITANPVVGRLSDAVVAMGGTTILTEVPEMFGAETELLNRCKSAELFEKAAGMINDFKEYFISHGQPVGENPSPGNKEGGITTLEDKSSGCVQKGGTAPVSGVLLYGEQVTAGGLNLLCAPGNDLVSSTALAAAGAQLILFTTGRGTPFSAPAPTVKISTNTALFEKKSGWIDFDAGCVAEGEDIDEAAGGLMKLVLEIAGGRRTKSELHSQRGIAIWKGGVTL